MGLPKSQLPSETEENNMISSANNSATIQTRIDADLAAQARAAQEAEDRTKAAEEELLVEQQRQAELRDQQARQEAANRAAQEAIDRAVKEAADRARADQEATLLEQQRNDALRAQQALEAEEARQQAANHALLVAQQMARRWRQEEQRTQQLSAQSTTHSMKS